MSVQITAMHMSDGLVNAPTSVLFGALAIAAMAFCAWKARTELDERTVPLAGLVAAFIFAVQMINFPILPGVSGHLLGGALAAILVGPYTGVLCIAIVLVVQSLLFADGGVTALGMNITNMALIGVAAGYSTAVALYAPGSTTASGAIRPRARRRRIRRRTGRNCLRINGIRHRVRDRGCCADVAEHGGDLHARHPRAHRDR